MRIYMDYAATTPVDPRVLKIMEPYFLEKFGNSMSIHKEGREAREILEESREIVASMINAKNNEIIFVGSATESTNTALKGVAFVNKSRGKHIIISAIEHHCVLEPARWLEDQGFEVTRLPVDEFGLVDLEDLDDAIRKNTIIVSIMHANNEIGTIQNIEKIGNICYDNGVYFHTDAAQSFGKIPIDVEKMHIDLLSMNSHKMYGPKGVGGLYVRRGVRIVPLLHGGRHEFVRRASTVNIPGVVGFAEAVKIQKEENATDFLKQVRLRDRLINEILKIEDSNLSGHPTKRLPNHASFWFKYIEGEAMLMHLDMNGISASTGSACSSDSLEASHVLLAIGLKPQEAHGSLRLSIGKYTTKRDVDYVIDVISNAIEKLRKISPFKGSWKH